MLKCKDCEKYMSTATKGQGVCSLPNSFFLTKAENSCGYLVVEEKRCKDCTHFYNDMGCLWKEEKDEICSAFIALDIDNMTNTWFDMLLEGKDVRNEVNKMLDEFYQDKQVQFVQEHRADIVKGASDE